MGYSSSVTGQDGWIVAKFSLFYVFMDQDKVKVHKHAKMAKIQLSWPSKFGWPQRTFHMKKVHCFHQRSTKSFSRVILRASAWETGADLEMKVGRFCLKLVHKVVTWTYVICQSFSFNNLFSEPSSGYQPVRGPQRLIFSVILATFQSLF